MPEIDTALRNDIHTFNYVGSVYLSLRRLYSSRLREQQQKKLIVFYKKSMK